MAGPVAIQLPESIMIRHIYVHDHRRKTRDDPRGPVTMRSVQYNPSWGQYGNVTIPAGTPVKNVGGHWAVASVSEAARFLGGGTANAITRSDAEHHYLFVPADAVGTHDAKLSPEDIAEIKTEKRRKGWSEAQIKEYIKEQEAKTGDAGSLKHTETEGNATVKVYWDAGNKEYTCRLFVDGKENVNASYFTDEFEDAKNTAKDMARRANTQK